MGTSRTLRLLQVCWALGAGWETDTRFPLLPLPPVLCSMTLCIPACHQVATTACSQGPCSCLLWPHREAHKFKPRVFSSLLQEVREHGNHFVSPSLQPVSSLWKLTHEKACMPTCCLQLHHLSSPHRALLQGPAWDLGGTATEGTSRKGGRSNSNTEELSQPFSSIGSLLTLP